MPITRSQTKKLEYQNIEITCKNNTRLVKFSTPQKEDQPNIVCPYTGSTDVYQVDSSTWASYETDEPFIVRIKINDEED
jgi:hypothetical protein